MIAIRSNVCLLSYEEDSIFGTEQKVALFNKDHISEDVAKRCLIAGEPNSHILTMTKCKFDELFFTQD